MPTHAKFFVTAVIAVAATGLVGALLLTKVLLPDPAIFAYCLALALLSSTFKVRLPGMRNSIAASFVIFLIAMANLSVAATMLITIPCTVLQCLWRPKSRPKFIQVAFSVACTLISTGIAALLFYSVDHKSSLVPAVVIAATAFFLVNSVLIATVIGLVQSKSIAWLWRELHRWAFPYYLGGALVAGLVVMYSHVAGFHQALAMTPLLYSVYVCYDTYVAGAQRQRAVAQ